MRIQRHFVTVGSRRVHYRTIGSGPPVLLIHQNPRSSAEMRPLMHEWSRHFTCIAPDTAGLGLSDPLEIDTPGIAEISASLIGFMDAIGLQRAGAFGFHSAAVQLMEALRNHPDRFFAVTLGAYGLWTADEQSRFDDTFIPRFVPKDHGEHLPWLWNRLVEQSWFFPWHASHQANRLPARPIDIAAVDELAGEWLDAGDSYRQAFAGCLRAPRSLPEESAQLPPVLITAYESDPLRQHLKRAASLPGNWRIAPVATERDQRDASRDFLLARAGTLATPPLPTKNDEGFIHVCSGGFDGLLHWRGRPGASRAVLHAPGSALKVQPADDSLHLDLPGHGLSDPFDGKMLADWAEITAQAIGKLSGNSVTTIAGCRVSALLALAVGRQLGAVTVEGIDAHIPLPADTGRWIAAQADLAPRRFGEHLVKAWGIARAQECFWPWFDVSEQTAIPVADGALSADRLAVNHRDLLRSRPGARALLTALLTADRDDLVATAPPITHWRTAAWAATRPDIWRPDLGTQIGDA